MEISKEEKKGLEKILQRLKNTVKHSGKIVSLDDFDDWALEVECRLEDIENRLDSLEGKG